MKLNKKTEKIVLFGDKNLRQLSTEVTVFNKKLYEKIDTMINTLRKNKNGAALAAPQIGINKKIVVVEYLGEYLEIINPKIIEASGEQYDFEGCLSLPRYIGKVRRNKKIIINYQDRYGEERTIERFNEMARCLQHEIDHLNGILFIDKMEEAFLINTDTEEEVDLRVIKEMSR